MAASEGSFAVSAAQAYQRDRLHHSSLLARPTVGGGGCYWITECPSRTVVKAMDTNGKGGPKQGVPRQTNKQINKTK